MKIKFTLILCLICLSLANRAPAPTFSDANWISMAASNYNFFVHGLGVAGKSLYAGHLTTLRGDPISHIVKWDGSSWREVGSMLGEVQALAGSGSDLYVARSTTIPYSSISKWNGSNWNHFGSVGNPQEPGGTSYPVVYALAASGSNLYVGGSFRTLGDGTTPATNIAKWDGRSWSALGSGMNGSVHALAVSGTDLYAGGYFTNAGGIPANRIAKWNGITWSALGSGVDGFFVYALAVSGNDLYVGGYFTAAGGIPATNIAKWNGSNWSPLGSGMNSLVYALAVSGSDLYAAGDFTTAGGSRANYIAKWDGSTWSALGSGLSSSAFALAVSDNDLYVAGGFMSPYIRRAVLGDAPGYNHLTPTRLSGSPMRFSYIGYPATNYALDRTVNLAPPINWVGQQTNTMTVSGVLTFTNTPVPGTNNFWRVRSVP